MSQDLMRWQMGDPMLVLMSKQQAEKNRSCAGCQHAKEIVDPFGGAVMRCLKAKPYGKKCRQYARSES